MVGKSQVDKGKDEREEEDGPHLTVDGPFDLVFIKPHLLENDKQMKILGWVATFMSVMMYVSYFPQIMDNLAGHKGNFIQPLVAAINCSLWVYYGLFKKERDIPLAAANAPGIIFGLITAITAL